MRTPREAVNLTQGIALTHASTYPFDRFPLGEGYERIRLSFLNTEVVGTGATPNALGSYAYIKNVRLKTSKNEQVVDCPGLGLYLLHMLLHGCEPVYTTMAAGSAAYQAVLDLPFAIPMLSKQEDTFLDSAQYNKLELAVDTGTPTDFLTAPGTATFASVMDITVVQSKAAMLNRQPITKGMDLSKLSRPIYVPYIRHLPCMNPTAQQFINIEISDDLYLCGIVGFAQINNPTLVPYFQPGTPSPQLLNVSFGDNFIPNYVGTCPPMHFLQEARNRIRVAPAAGGYTGVGIYPIYFIQPTDSSASVRQRYWTGQKSQVQISWTAAGGANPSVDWLLFGFRKMRP